MKTFPYPFDRPDIMKTLIEEIGKFTNNDKHKNSVNTLLKALQNKPKKKLIY